MAISVTTNINLRLAEFRGDQAWSLEMHCNDKQGRKNQDHPALQFILVINCPTYFVHFLLVTG